MGRDKMRLTVSGVSLLGHQCNTLQKAGSSELILSTRFDSPIVIPQAKTALDDHGDIGPIAGISAVIEAASYPVVFISAVDLPAITPNAIRHILSLSNEQRGCIPLVHGRHEPLAAAYPRSLLPLAQDQIAEGSHAMRNLTEKPIAAGWMTSLTIAETEPFVNCNLPAEWHAFLERRDAGPS
jgi:molybdopterin-guanine dinucleotide biosynthesis protein A